MFHALLVGQGDKIHLFANVTRYSNKPNGAKEYTVQCNLFKYLEAESIFRWIYIGILKEKKYKLSNLVRFHLNFSFCPTTTTT